MRALSKLRDGLVGAWCPSVSGWGGTVLRDLSGQGNHGTLTNMDPASDWVTSGGYGALDFDGVDDFATIQQTGAIPRQGPFSFGIWVRTPNVNPAANVGIFAHGQLNGWKILLFPNTSSIRLNRFGVANLDVSWSVLSGLNNIFFHLGITYANDWKLFVNGVLRGTATGGYNTTTGVFPEIGRTTGGFEAGQFNGQLDDIRIYNRALSEHEIRLLASERGIGLRPQRTRRYHAASSFSPSWVRRQSLIGSGVY